MSRDVGQHGGYSTVSEYSCGNYSEEWTNIHASHAWHNELGTVAYDEISQNSRNRWNLQSWFDGAPQNPCRSDGNMIWHVESYFEYDVPETEVDGVQTHPIQFDQHEPTESNSSYSGSFNVQAGVGYGPLSVGLAEISLPSRNVSANLGLTHADWTIDHGLATTFPTSQKDAFGVKVTAESTIDASSDPGDVKADFVVEESLVYEDTEGYLIYETMPRKTGSNSVDVVE